MSRFVALLCGFVALATARQCRNLRVPVTLSSRNAVFDLDPLRTAIEVTDFYLQLGRQGNNLTDNLLTGYADVTGRYELAATLCEPDSGPGDVLQIMTHGIGFDRTYWDLPVQKNKYSYVSRAVDDYGYSTLTWDRLGVGASSKAKDTVNELQIALEIAALKELTNQAASGRLCGSGHKYDNIVHLGHSFGSFITYNLVNADPDISKGIVLTGYSQIPIYLGLFALGGNFVPVKSVRALAKKYPVGYVAAGTKQAVHTNFFGPGDFDPVVLDYVYKNGQPNTPGEILTVAQGAAEVNKFSGPVLIITGHRDIPFCGGDCMATSAVNDEFPNLIAASEPNFPNASPFNATVVPDAGHGLNLGYSAFGAFDSILSFLDAHVS